MDHDQEYLSYLEGRGYNVSKSEEGKFVISEELTPNTLRKIMGKCPK